ncbi:hypothetical protein ACLESO_26385 [Pyxidicoccus sp. 3LG]
MQVKRFAGSALLVAGLLAGCGGAGADTQDTSQLVSRDDALPSCGGQEYERVFYSEPEMLNEIGGWLCFCGDNSVLAYGRTSRYSQYLYQNTCAAPPAAGN